MAELPSNLKRKTRNSSGSEAVSPDGKRICEVNNKEIDSSADGNGKTETMTEIITQQLQQRTGKAYKRRRQIRWRSREGAASRNCSERRQV